ncbi:MAG: exopolygalacturonate lyase [Massilibacillus sp.]|jgi:pectin methylesterase-like acyl-CoA thioesterase|nr:exopolygalacturonate lyase [Massilibacillus sp.]
MKIKKMLSVLICTAVASFIGTALNINIVQAAAEDKESIERLIKAEHPNMIVDGKFTGENGKKIKGICMYKTVGAAIGAVVKENQKPVKILVRSGTYRERLKITKPDIILIGENAETTQIVFNDAEGTVVRSEDGGDGKKMYRMDCASVTVEDTATGFTAINITFNNDFDEAANMQTMDSRQAFAMKNEADRSTFVHCRFLGNQDTLFANKNRQYYYQCYIEGDIDFIFGAATAVYEKCEIKSLDREGDTKGYITAPSTLIPDKGYLFLDCKLISNITKEGSVKLGRPWHPSSEERPVNSSAVFKNCEMGAHIAEIGWDHMMNKYGDHFPEDNNLFEYGSTGPGALTSTNRRTLTNEQAKECTPKTYLGDWDIDSMAKKLLKAKAYY